MSLGRVAALAVCSVICAFACGLLAGGGVVLIGFPPLMLFWWLQVLLGALAGYWLAALLLWRANLWLAIPLVAVTSIVTTVVMRSLAGVLILLGPLPGLVVGVLVMVFCRSMAARHPFWAARSTVASPGG